jgi:hypothetical protein
VPIHRPQALDLPADYLGVAYLIGFIALVFAAAIADFAFDGLGV